MAHVNPPDALAKKVQKEKARRIEWHQRQEEWNLPQEKVVKEPKTPSCNELPKRFLPDEGAEYPLGLDREQCDDFLKSGNLVFIYPTYNSFLSRGPNKSILHHPGSICLAQNWILYNSSMLKQLWYGPRGGGQKYGPFECPNPQEQVIFLVTEPEAETDVETPIHELRRVFVICLDRLRICPGMYLDENNTTGIIDRKTEMDIFEIAFGWSENEFLDIFTEWAVWVRSWGDWMERSCPDRGVFARGDERFTRAEQGRLSCLGEWLGGSDEFELEVDGIRFTREGGYLLDLERFFVGDGAGKGKGKMVMGDFVELDGLDEIEENRVERNEIAIRERKAELDKWIKVAASEQPEVVAIKQIEREEKIQHLRDKWVDSRVGWKVQAGLEWFEEQEKKRWRELMKIDIKLTFSDDENCDEMEEC